MTEPADADGPIDDFTELVNANGLVRLFANRARARILVTLFYAEEPFTVAEIAEGAGIYKSVVHEALDPLGQFDILETVEGEDRTRYRLAEDDELVAAIRTLAEIATDRYFADD